MFDYIAKEQQNWYFMAIFASFSGPKYQIKLCHGGGCVHVADHQS